MSAHSLRRVVPYAPSHRTIYMYLYMYVIGGDQNSDPPDSKTWDSKIKAIGKVRVSHPFDWAERRNTDRQPNDQSKRVSMV